MCFFSIPQNLNCIVSSYPKSVKCCFIIFSKGGGPQYKISVSGPGAGMFYYNISFVMKPTPCFQFSDSAG